MSVRVHSWFWPVALLACACAAAFLPVLPDDAVVRRVGALVFLAVCPGLAWTRLLNLRDWFIELPLAVALSIALGTLVMAVLVYTGVGSAVVALDILVGVTLAGAGFQLAVDPRTRWQARQDRR